MQKTRISRSGRGSGGWEGQDEGNMVGEWRRRPRVMQRGNYKKKGDSEEGVRTWSTVCGSRRR